MADHTRIADYPHQLAGHCGSGALRDLLHWAGLSWQDNPLSEGTVFGLGGQLGFTYLRHATLQPPIYLVGRGPDLTDALARRLGLSLTRQATDDPEQGWSWVRDELDQGYPVLCWADIAELPYLRVRLSMSRHDIVLIGYDEHTRTATVIDNDRAEPQQVGYEALARARASTGFPVPTRHTTYRLRYPTTLPALAPTAADACQAAAAVLRQPESSLLGNSFGNMADLVHATGLDGITTFATDLACWHDHFPPDQLNITLHTLAAFIDKAGTGGGLFRRLQADYLTWLAETTRLPAAQQAADTYTHLAHLWSELATHAAANTDPTNRLTAATTTAQQLPTLEHRSADELTLLARALIGPV